jgi:hypothetical protein
MYAETEDCRVKMPLNLLPGFTKEQTYFINMTFHQFPLIVNNCTTVHKLQGTTKNALYITAWNKAACWAYVALSRIRTLDGLFIRAPITADFNIPPHPALLRMLDRMKRNLSLIPFDDD